MLPVWAAAMIVSMTMSSRWSGMIISILVLGKSQRRIRHTIEFSMAALSSKAAHFTHGHTLDARGVKLFFDLVQLEGFDDRFNFFS